MTPLKIILDGTDVNDPNVEVGKYAGKLIREGKLTQVMAMPQGMVGGRTSIALTMELSDGSVVFAETSLRLFRTAALAFHARYGDEE